MLYLDYSRKDGEWIPNQYGGKENIDAIDFLRRFNEEVYRHFPDVQTYRRGIDRVGDGVAADVRRRARLRLQVGHGLDARHAASTSRYDPIHRKYHQNDLTFRMLYAYNENFVLPLSHDEVVHGKGPLWDKMAGRRVAEVRRAAAAVRLPVGDDRQEAAVHGRRDRPAAGVAARPRASTGTCCSTPPHKGVQQLGPRPEPALRGPSRRCTSSTTSRAGSSGSTAPTRRSSVISFVRRGKSADDVILCVFNFTPVPRMGYRVGVPGPGYWTEVLNTDAGHYWRQQRRQRGRRVRRVRCRCTASAYSLFLNLPPLGGVFFKGRRSRRVGSRRKGAWQMSHLDLLHSHLLCLA